VLKSVMPVMCRARAPEVLPALMPDLPVIPEVLPALVPEPALPSRVPADLPPGTGRQANQGPMQKGTAAHGPPTPSETALTCEGTGRTWKGTYRPKPDGTSRICQKSP
jgi:hypothetical protein